FFAITQRTSLRAKATHQSKVLQRLAVGTEVELLEKTRASWWKVRIAQREGWVKSKLLEKIDHRS
ncbi:MAG: SH3 domain-containing protein, partial [Bacteroidota bacterium]